MAASEIDLCLIPSGTPPTGLPNFVNLPSLEPALIGITAAMMAWAIIFLTGRLWINRHRLQIADGMWSSTALNAITRILFC